MTPRSRPGREVRRGERAEHEIEPARAGVLVEAERDLELAAAHAGDVELLEVAVDVAPRIVVGQLAPRSGTRWRSRSRPRRRCASCRDRSSSVSSGSSVGGLGVGHSPPRSARGSRGACPCRSRSTDDRRGGTTGTPPSASSLLGRLFSSGLSVGPACCVVLAGSVRRRRPRQNDQERGGRRISGMEPLPVSRNVLSTDAKSH